MSYGKAFKQARLNHNYTQKQIAKFLEITEQAYQNYEYGMRIPRLDVLIKLADFFKIGVVGFVGGIFHN